MDDVGTRLLVVAAALAAVLVLVVIRRRASRAVRRVESGILPNGVYLFSSDRCETCERARMTLDRALGEDGYIEKTWEDESEMFTDVGVDAVPSVVVIDDTGGRLYPGQPGRALRAIQDP